MCGSRTFSSSQSRYLSFLNASNNVAHAATSFKRSYVRTSMGHELDDGDPWGWFIPSSILIVHPTTWHLHYCFLLSLFISLSVLCIRYYTLTKRELVTQHTQYVGGHVCEGHIREDDTCKGVWWVSIGARCQVVWHHMLSQQNMALCSRTLTRHVKHQAQHTVVNKNSDDIPFPVRDCCAPVQQNTVVNLRVGRNNCSNNYCRHWWCITIIISMSSSIDWSVKTLIENTISNY